MKQVQRVKRVNGVLRVCMKGAISRYSTSEKAAIFQRLKDLKDESVIDKSDPLANMIKGVFDKNEKLIDIYEKLPQKEFEHKYCSNIVHAKLGPHVHKHARDIALSKPWTGEEQILDTSMRMIVDNVKPAGSGNNGSANANTTSSKSHMKLRKLRARLETTQDDVINYRAKRDKSENDSEASQFRALLAEKFTPIGSFEKLQSIAEVRIEESIKSGAFDSLSKMRGRSHQNMRLQPHIERTEQRLNDILVRQNSLPPWIEKQCSVNGEVADFRRQLISSLDLAFSCALKRHDFHDKVSELSHSQLQHYVNSRRNILEDLKSGVFYQWKHNTKQLMKDKIRGVNNTMRSYNLQAPLSTQKYYLILEKEYQRAYENVSVTKSLQNFVAAQRLKKINQVTTQNSQTSLKIKFPTFLKFW
ncbi:LAMI_0G10242g1_1 [Lachancea mirantina]|uniref:LAMI_0G10242g1_1 n=1 Tax=Lachancea mirantina TaxID=1230905 RepID=A0A1G4KAJ6_9SACH|nr:LAMI_0G10242g1_1 [Lachancea mirantina]